VQEGVHQLRCWAAPWRYLPLMIVINHKLHQML
jgi:hypothetical protein